MVIGVLAGGYMGGAAVNHSANPGSWNFKSGKTWAGLGKAFTVGALLGGALSGVGRGLRMVTAGRAAAEATESIDESYSESELVVRHSEREARSELRRRSGIVVAAVNESAVDELHGKVLARYREEAGSLGSEWDRRNVAIDGEYDAKVINAVGERWKREEFNQGRRLSFKDKKRIEEGVVSNRKVRRYARGAVS